LASRRDQLSSSCRWKTLQVEDDPAQLDHLVGQLDVARQAGPELVQQAAYQQHRHGGADRHAAVDQGQPLRQVDPQRRGGKGITEEQEDVAQGGHRLVGGS
jgi:hypothetical protein